MKKVILIIIIMLLASSSFASYKIVSTEVKGDTINVTTEYTFSDMSKKTIVVPVFMPSDKSAVLTSLANREVSEQRSVNATANNLIIKADIDKTTTAI